MKSNAKASFLLSEESLAVYKKYFISLVVLWLAYQFQSQKREIADNHKEIKDLNKQLDSSRQRELAEKQRFADYVRATDSTTFANYKEVLRLIERSNKPDSLN